MTLASMKVPQRDSRRGGGQKCAKDHALEVKLGPTREHSKWNKNGCVHLDCIIIKIRHPRETGGRDPGKEGLNLPHGRMGGKARSKRGR